MVSVGEGYVCVIFHVVDASLTVPGMVLKLCKYI
jgi:hypothetical protein